MKVSEYITALGAKIVSSADTDNEITGCCVCDLLSLVMSKAGEGDAWITVQGNVNVAAVAVLTGCACVVIADGMKADEPLTLRAQQQKITLLETEMNAYEAAKILARSGI